MAKIYDCFPFFNELELLEMRLKLHAPVVDHFVISESTHTFMGNPKPLYFLENRHRFSEWEDKIIYIQVDDFPETTDPFVREYHQRDSLLKAAANAADDDMFIISDLDELLRPERILEASNFDGFITFNMPMFVFYLNLQESENGWRPCYATRKKYLMNIENVSTARWDRSQIDQDLGPRGKILDLHNAGWHFTHLGGIERLKTKFKAYSHANDKWPQAMMHENALEQHIIAGGIIGNFKESSRFVPIDYPKFPRIIHDNQTHYKEIGFIKDVYEALSELQILYKDVRHKYASLCKNDTREHAALSWVTPQEFAQLSDINLDNISLFK